MIYYSKRMQRKISKGRGMWGAIQGITRQKLPSPVGSHRTHLTPPAIGCNDTCEKLSVREAC